MHPSMHPSMHHSTHQSSRMSRRPPAPRRRAAPPAPRKAAAVFALHGEAAFDPTWAPVLTRAAIAVAILLGVALLVMVFGPHRIGDYFTETDFYGGYAEGARAIQHGQLDPSRYGVVGPVYDLALALAGGVVRDLFLAAELLSVLCAVASPTARCSATATRSPPTRSPLPSRRWR